MTAKEKNAKEEALCPICGEKKPLKDGFNYYKRSNGITCPAAYCKECESLDPKERCKTAISKGLAREGVHIGVRKCADCGITKDISEFPIRVRKGNTDVRLRRCTECNSELRSRKYAEQHSTEWGGIKRVNKIIDGKRVCKRCGEVKDISEFITKPRGKSPGGTILPRCESCRAEERKEYRESEWGKIKTLEARQKYLDLNSKRRRNPKEIPQVMLNDYRYKDKKKGRENDLDVEFIAKMISRGCTYCGEKGLRMTLDRIDNSKGHTKASLLLVLGQVYNRR